jgi:Ca2+-binding EF-hand superfamily protein
MPAKDTRGRAAASVALFAALVLGATSGRAAEPEKRYDPHTAFAETDSNNDGSIDRGEFHLRIVEVFYFADTDKDGYLSPDEQKRLVFPEDFTADDKDGDGRISLREFLRVRFADFDAVDTDHDGMLSLDEVVGAYAKKSAK